MELLDVLDDEGNFTGQIEEMEKAFQEHDSSYTFINWSGIDKSINYLKQKRKELREE